MRPGAPLVLSEVLPLLEDLGVTVVDERTHEIRVEGRSVWRYDIGLRVSDPGRIDDRAPAAEFCATFAALFRGELESDGLNQLVVAGGLSARQVDVLRAYAQVPAPDRPLVQPALRRDDAGPSCADRRRARAAVRDPLRPAIDPDVAQATARIRAADAQALTDSITAQLDAVPSLDEDRILRSFLTLILATHRTNAYRPRSTLTPRPAAGPCSPSSSTRSPSPICRCPGRCSRSGCTRLGWRACTSAAGRWPAAGLRWSDRREDFRTEVLGLMKAQMVKNAVIVPVGAKGGFVVKRRERIKDADALRTEVAECYREFVAGLLDVTDNVVDGDGRLPARRGPPRRGRPLPGRGGRQGHGHVLRPRQLRRRELRLLAGGRVRVRRQRRLRPQGHGHHRPRRVGERPSPRPQPRSGRRHGPADRRRRRRHVGRRVRQRDAAQPAPAPGGRLRPPPHLPRPRSRPGPRVRRAASASSTCPAPAGTTTTGL